MNMAIKNHARGELVMCLDADSMLAPNAIEKAVAYFKDPQVIGLAANVRVVSSKGWLGTLQRFEHMIGYRAKKFYTLTNSEFIVGGVASTYRRRVLKQANFYDTDTLTEDIGLSMKLISMKGNRSSKIVYAADVVAMTEGVQTYKALFKQRYRWKLGSLQNLFKYRHLISNSDHGKYSRMLTYYRLPVALFGELLLIIEPLLLGYVIYLSVTYHTPVLLLGAYMVVTLYVLWTIWPDEHMGAKQKLAMSVQAFGIYVLFYAMDLVQVTAIFRTLKNRKKVTRRLADQGWVTPERSNSAISAILQNEAEDLVPDGSLTAQAIRTVRTANTKLGYAAAESTVRIEKGLYKADPIALLPQTIIRENRGAKTASVEPYELSEADQLAAALAGERQNWLLQERTLSFHRSNLVTHRATTAKVARRSTKPLTSATRPSKASHLEKAAVRPSQKRRSTASRQSLALRRRELSLARQ